MIFFRPAFARRSVKPNDEPCCRLRAGGKPVPTFRDHALVLALLVAATAGADRAARAADCLAGPNGPSPQGSHWYYRIDRPTHRKCWYLGDLKRRQAVAKQTNTARRSVAPPEPADEPPAPPQVRAREAADPGPGPRWSDAAPSTAIVAGPPRVLASTAPIPEAIGARPVPTERVRNEPAPPKPMEPAKPQAAAPPAAAPAPASETHGGLLAALFGIALLLAVVGTLLVRARPRRIGARGVAPARGMHASAAQDSGRPRRSLREILAQADLAGSPDEREARYPGSPHFAPLMRATTDAARPDIAAATLQPAIEPLEPEPVAAAPDVEQSLRRLLAAWERRAA